MCTNCIILNIFRIESVKVYKIFWYIILSVLSIVLLCIHWPVDTNKRWYFYPIYYGSSNTLRSIVYQSNLFRTENLRQCVFHRETFKGQQHDLKAYHAWDNFSKSDPVFHFTAINVFNIDYYVIWFKENHSPNITDHILNEYFYVRFLCCWILDRVIHHGKTFEQY